MNTEAQEDIVVVILTLGLGISGFGTGWFARGIELERTVGQPDWQQSEPLPGPNTCCWNAPLLPQLNDTEFTEIAYRLILGRERDHPGMNANSWNSRWAYLGTMVASEEFQKRRLPGLRRR